MVASNIVLKCCSPAVKAWPLVGPAGSCRKIFSYEQQDAGETIRLPPGGAGKFQLHICDEGQCSVFPYPVPRRRPFPMNVMHYANYLFFGLVATRI